MSFGITQRVRLLPPFQRQLTPERLEFRCLLSVSSTDDAAMSGLDDVAAIDPQSDVADFGDATEFWQAVVKDEILAAGNGTAAVESESPSAEADPLPVIPIDDSTEPLYECPGVDHEFCLPGDVNLDGSVDFSDYLLFNQHYGLQDATWQDGDFDGDGIVAFSDFLILSNNFGAVG